MANIFHTLERPISWSYLASHGGLHDEVLRRQLTQRLDVATRKPIMDISETDAAYMIRADIPGSLSALLPVFFVIPKAVNTELFNLIFF